VSARNSSREVAPARPFPLLLVYREKTKCRQYPFFEISAFEKWAARRPYNAENLRVQIISQVSRRVERDTGFLPAAEAVISVKGGRR
jgi:hypothetical protein